MFFEGDVLDDEIDPNDVASDIAAGGEKVSLWIVKTIFEPSKFFASLLKAASVYPLFRSLMLPISIDQSGILDEKKEEAGLSATAYKQTSSSSYGDAELVVPPVACYRKVGMHNKIVWSFRVESDVYTRLNFSKG